MTPWRSTTIGEVLTLQRGYDITAARQRAGNVPVISSGGPSSYHDESISAGPGVVIGRKGTLGKVFYSPGPFWPHDTTLWVKDFQGSDPRFVYYFFKALDVTFLDVGSANPTLNRNHVHPLPVRWPDVDAQQSIAEVLGALDDKVAANDRVCVLADEAVRALIDNVAGPGTIRIEDLGLNIREQVGPPFDDGAYIGLEHVPRRHIWMVEAGQAPGLASGKFKFEAGDVLFGKLRPYFHKVVVADRPGVCSTDILVVRAQRPELSGFLWGAIASDLVVQRVSAKTEGTRMPRTNWSDLAACEVPWPGESEARRISQIVEALAVRVAATRAESRHLVTLRDTLLPHLMSGSMTVRQAEALADGAL